MKPYKILVLLGCIIFSIGILALYGSQSGVQPYSGIIILIGSLLLFWGISKKYNKETIIKPVLLPGLFLALFFNSLTPQSFTFIYNYTQSEFLLVSKYSPIIITAFLSGISVLLVEVISMVGRGRPPFSIARNSLIVVVSVSMSSITTSILSEFPLVEIIINFPTFIAPISMSLLLQIIFHVYNS